MQYVDVVLLQEEPLLDGKIGDFACATAIKRMRADALQRATGMLPTMTGALSFVFTSATFTVDRESVRMSAVVRYDYGAPPP